MRPRIVLGIDPGTRVMGYGAVAGPPAALLRAGIFRAPASAAVPERLGRFAELLRELFQELGLAAGDLVVLEKAYVGRSAASSLRVGEARGMAIAAVYQSGATLVELTPAEAKRAITGSGSASKEQVAGMVGRLLGISVEGEPLDATDALALALAGLRALLVPTRRPTR